MNAAREYPEGLMPSWEYGGTFRHAWGGVTKLLEREHIKEEIGVDILRLLQLAHVINLDREQFHALPELDDWTQYAPDPHLAFPVLYVSTGVGTLVTTQMFSTPSQGPYSAPPATQSVWWSSPFGRFVRS